MENCLFCKIAKKEIQAAVIYENDYVLAFNDISPQAPVHILIIPKIHISTPADINPENSSEAGRLLETAAAIAKDMGLEGYRLVMNCNEIAGQSVFHLHCHMLAGREMKWPPG